MVWYYGLKIILRVGRRLNKRKFVKRKVYQKNLMFYRCDFLRSLVGQARRTSFSEETGGSCTGQTFWRFGNLINMDFYCKYRFFVLDFIRRELKYSRRK